MNDETAGEPAGLHESVERILAGLDDPGPNDRGRIGELIEGTVADIFLRETSLPPEEAYELLELLRTQQR